MTKRIHFTQAAINNLPLPVKGQRLVVSDTELPGLQCRVSNTGVKTYSVLRRTKNGVLERITLGRHSDINVKEARDRAKKVGVAIADGANPAELKRTIKGEMTFGELFTVFLEEHAKRKKRTWKGDEGRYNYYLKTKFENKRISEITRSDVAALHSEISARVKKIDKETRAVTYVSGTTANRILALISAVYNFAISRDLCTINPAKGVKKNTEQSRDRFLQADELPRFFKAVEKEENPVVRDFIFVSLFTGARRQNVCEMAWKDISFERKEWRIPRTKNNDPQIIPLGKEVMKILKDRLKEQSFGSRIKSPYVFPSSGRNGHLAEPRKGWQRVLKAAGITNLRIHDLRRTFGSWQAITGASLIVVGKSLGHKSPQATAIYSRLDLAPVRKSVESATHAMFLAAQSIKSKFNAAAQLPAEPDLVFLPFQIA
jgi:integrase